MQDSSDALAETLRKKLAEGSIKLPSLPDTVLKVQRLLAGDGYSAADIAHIINQDNAMAASILRIANSTHFNPGGHAIRNMVAAVQRIGAQAILRLLIGVASRMLCKVRNPELRDMVSSYQEHSLMVAAAAERIAHISQAAAPSDAFMAGLLHDQGKDVLIMGVPDELLQVAAPERRKVISMFHREMGARLMLRWGLPEEFPLVAQHHGIESPDRPKLAILDCVDVANALVKQLRGDPACLDPEAIGRLPASVRLRLSEARMTGIIVDIEDNIEELRHTFAT